MNDPDDFADDFAPDDLLPARAMRAVASGLVHAFLAGDSDPASLRERGRHALGENPRWLPSLVLHLRQEFGAPFTAHQHDALLEAVLAYRHFRQAFLPWCIRPRIRAHFAFHPPMGEPPAALTGLAVPALATPGELADWLGLLPNELAWFCGNWQVSPSQSKLDHYRYRWLRKTSGGARLIEAPKETLRAIQRRILHGILDKVPVHAAATGCVRGLSVVDNARRHAASPLLLKMDLRDFFASIPAGRVFALFRTLGYPAASAHCLTQLCTHATPMRVLRQLPQDEYASPEARRQAQAWARRFATRHLPQGAPTSPALANLCAYRLDLRLAGLARECHAAYSRYVDDLAFSLPRPDAARARRIQFLVEEIIIQEGFAPNWRKTRRCPASQAQMLTGLLINRHPNLPRAEYDRLKAILTNCRRHGPGGQNRDQHPDFRAYLQGRLAWLRQVNPGKGEKLLALFGQIDWS
ncbi:reverse transcriptase family protein [Azonexus caeni]|jgi:RNA-directed DNA polymerase|uniref:reverse transcriptase family protein n=1 Tax=Azonexus caeni TaxID=266126 RepID=UPI003A86B2F5